MCHYWIFLLLLWAGYGRAEQEEGGHIYLKPQGAILHAHVLKQEFEAGQPADLAVITFQELDPNVHRGFQLTTKDIANVRWYTSSEGPRRQKLCEITGLFWECVIPPATLALLSTENPSDKIILRGTIKINAVKENATIIRKDIMGLPNDQFSAIERIYLRANPAAEPLRILSQPAILVRPLIPEEQDVEDIEEERGEEQPPAVAETATEHLLVRREPEPEPKSTKEIETTFRKEEAPKPQIKKQKTKPVERNLKAEELALGTESIHRGTVHTQSNGEATRKRSHKDELSIDKKRGVGTGKTTINLNFDGMLPECGV